MVCINNTLLLLYFHSTTEVIPDDASVYTRNVGRADIFVLITLCIIFY